MRKRTALLAGLAAIDAGITELKGIVANVNERVQQLAVSIISHDVETGDCSRALKLVNVLPNSYRREFLIRYFEYFGAIGIDVKGQKVKHIDTNSKRYRKPDVAAAKEHNWFEPFDANGKRADWYAGPNPAAFEPNTLGNLGQNVLRFADRFLGTDGKAGDLSKTKDNGSGKQVPLYDLTDAERKQAETVFNGVRKLGLMLMARERTEALTAEVVELNDFVAQTEKVLAPLEKLGKQPDDPNADELQAEVA